VDTCNQDFQGENGNLKLTVFKFLLLGLISKPENTTDSLTRRHKLITYGVKFNINWVSVLILNET